MRRLPLAVLLLLALAACAKGPPSQTGLASWYGKDFAGKPTASGETFRPRKRTAAHRQLPFGTIVRVTLPDTGRSVRVVITDRGPFVDGRILDLSRGAARRLRMIERGVAPVELRIVGCRQGYRRGCTR